MKIQWPTEGHEHVTWDPSKETEVAQAKQKFDEAIAAGHRAFRVERPTEPGEPVSEFDPSHEELLLVAPMSGG